MDEYAYKSSFVVSYMNIFPAKQTLPQRRASSDNLTKLVLMNDNRELLNIGGDKPFKQPKRLDYYLDFDLFCKLPVVMMLKCYVL